MKIRPKIKEKRDAIWKSVGSHGHSDGTEIATQEEMRWLIEQATKDGILLSVKADPDTWQQEDECYYYYTAISIKEEKERVRQFVDIYPLMTVGILNKLLNETEDPKAVENIKQIRRLIQARDRCLRKRKRDEEQFALECKIAEQIEAEREEAADHRNDLEWLVARIESMGWEVLLRRKPKEESNNIKE